MTEEKKKAWTKLSSQNEIDKNKGLIRGTEEQKSANRLKAHLDYCRQNSKNWRQQVRYIIRTIDGKDKPCKIKTSMHESRLMAYLDALIRNGHHSIVVEETVGISQ